MTDRLVVVLADQEVAMISELVAQDGFITYLGRQRPIDTWHSRHFAQLAPGLAWVTRWVELRADLIRAEVDRKLVQRAARQHRVAVGAISLQHPQT